MPWWAPPPAQPRRPGFPLGLLLPSQPLIEQFRPARTTVDGQSDERLWPLSRKIRRTEVQDELSNGIPLNIIVAVDMAMGIVFEKDVQQGVAVRGNSAPAARYYF